MNGVYLPRFLGINRPAQVIERASLKAEALLPMANTTLCSPNCKPKLWLSFMEAPTTPSRRLA